VEVGSSSQRLIAVRDSKEPEGPCISVTLPGWREFLGQVKVGELRLH
jgi:hypothetical protein